MTSSPTGPSEERPTFTDTDSDDAVEIDSTGLFGKLQGIVDRYDVEWVKEVVADLKAMDLAVYGAVAGVRTPTIDSALRTLTIAADHSKLWFGIAGATALLGGRRGRTAALDGVIAIGLTSLLVNQPLKRLLPRSRPDREHFEVIAGRRVPLPTSPSFPSGHSASAFAFANAMSGELTWVAFPVHFLAGAVAWSRVHTGVHYPGDVVVGALIGSAVGDVVGTVRRHRRERRLRSGRPA